MISKQIILSASPLLSLCLRKYKFSTKYKKYNINNKYKYKFSTTLDKVIFLVRNEINFIVEAGRTGHDMHMESFEPRKR